MPSSEKNSVNFILPHIRNDLFFLSLSRGYYRRRQFAPGFLSSSSPTRRFHLHPSCLRIWFLFFLSFFQHFPRNLFDFLLVFRLMLAVLQMVSFLFYLFLHVCVWGEKRRAIDVLVMEPNTHGACCAPYFLVCFLFLPLNFLVISYAGIIITCVAAVVEREGKIKSFYFFGGGV